MLSDTLRYRANIKAVLSELKDSWYFRELTDGDTITVSDVIPTERKSQSQKSVIEKRKYVHSHEWGNGTFYSSYDDELGWELYRLSSVRNTENVAEELNKKNQDFECKEEGAESPSSYLFSLIALPFTQSRQQLLFYFFLPK